jgi:calcineurin-like phosphoesterase family protein
MIWFTADTHFGDRRVLNIDRRLFPDMAGARRRADRELECRQEAG